MNNKVFSLILSFWWLPISAYSLTVLGSSYWEKRRLEDLQDRLVRKVLNLNMKTEQAFSRIGQKLTPLKKIPDRSVYCHSSEDKSFMLFFNKDQYYMASIESEKASDYIKSIEKYVVEKGSFRQENGSLFLESERGTLKEVRIAYYSKTSGEPRRLSFYSETLSSAICSHFEGSLAHEYIIKMIHQ